MKGRIFTIFFVISCILTFLFSTDSIATSEKSAFVYVVDVGAGLCTVSVIPDDSGYKYMVYDAGGERHKNHCIEAIKKIIPRTQSIDLMVISHTDADHLYNADDVLDCYSVKKVIRTGNTDNKIYERSIKYKPKCKANFKSNEQINCKINSEAWCEFDHALKVKEEPIVTEVINLQDEQLKPGTVLLETKNAEANAKVQYIAGWPKWPEGNKEEINNFRKSLGLPDEITEEELKISKSGNRKNAISIVVRLEYKDRSVLFAGDTVGRTEYQKNNKSLWRDCVGAELVMHLQHTANKVSIDSDVLVAPHHGANNANSECFIEDVSPNFVIFSAGNKHGHPRLKTFERYKCVASRNNFEMTFFRTDRGGEKETNNHADKEWLDNNKYTEFDMPKDKFGDDNVKIEIDSDGVIRVCYCSQFRDQDEQISGHDFCN